MKYRIEHRIRTLAQLWKAFEYKEFRFTQWDFTGAKGPLGDSWIAEKVIQADDASTAINRFRKDLTPIVDRIAFVSQCFALMDFESFMVVREGYADSTFFFRHSVEVPPVPLNFGDEELRSLHALESFNEKGDLFCLLRESANTSTFHARLAMLMSALESIAGSKVTGNRIETDKEFIKRDLLKDDALFKELFEYRAGIRNKMFHGDKISFKGDRQYVPEIHGAIVRFFNENYATNINQTVINPMRHFMGNYEVLNLFLAGPIRTSSRP